MTTDPRVEAAGKAAFDWDYASSAVVCGRPWDDADDGEKGWYYGIASAAIGAADAVPGTMANEIVELRSEIRAGRVRESALAAENEELTATVEADFETKREIFARESALRSALAAFVAACTPSHDRNAFGAENSCALCAIVGAARSLLSDESARDS